MWLFSSSEAIANLLSNSIKFTPPGGAVILRGVNQGGHTRIEVLDSGPGIPEAEREAVFQRFFRGSTSGRRSSSDGVGLGLALVHEQARLHGGQVWVEDVRPNGARFVVQLPKRQR